jgi:phosphotransferase system enzyme I (PtsI)
LLLKRFVKKELSSAMNKGIAVSPGVAVGTAYCIDQIFVNPRKQRLEDDEISAELARFEVARDKVTAELRALQRKVRAQVGDPEASIFAVQEAILRDSAITKKVRSWIVNDRKPAQAALQMLLEEYSQLFASMNDAYLRDRLADVRDVVLRLSSHLTDVLDVKRTPLTGPLVIVADELLPSQAVMLGDMDVQGIVTQRGSHTSHAAIIARSRGIPAVSGMEGILRQISTGDTIIIDGRAGHVIINPDPESLAAYRKLEREFVHLQDELAENRDLPPRTADGMALQLFANINDITDARAACAMGACGVGLYRTEYLYMTHPDVPNEDEQIAVYEQIIRESPNHVVTIRTLDIGGDKTIPYLGKSIHEPNPFMGWRSIRLSFEHPEFFLTQIRAVLRAAAVLPARQADVRVMFPMITTLEEMRRVRAMVLRASRLLTAEGKAHREIPVGMMLEVPAAAVSIRNILEHADFVSIGSNDLVQYLMAADRDNPKVNHLCQPLSPAVLRVLSEVIAKCSQAGKPVTVCGEMAGQPSAFVLLLGMGLRQFSMSPAFVPTIKKLASLISIPAAEDLVRATFDLKTTAQIKKFMARQIRELAPDLALLETE